VDAGHLPPLRLGSEVLVQKRRTDKDAFVILLTPETARVGERLFLPSLPVSFPQTIRPELTRPSDGGLIGASQSHVCDCEVVDDTDDQEGMV